MIVKIMKYLESLVNALSFNLENEEIPSKLDVVLEGGAMNGSIHIGALCYLKKLETMKKTKIMRISGASCGAIVGAMFLTIDINKIEEYYLKIVDDLLSTGSLFNLEKYIDEYLDEISDESVKNLTDKLYISYVDASSKRRIVISKYNCKDDLRDALIKTSFLPIIINGSITTNDNCIDCGIPYVFPNDLSRRQTKDYKTLYLRLLTFELLKVSLKTNGEINTCRRAIEGVQYVHDLFKSNQSNKYASIVEKWGKSEVIHLTIINIIWLIVTYYFISIKWIYNNIIPKNIKEHPFTLRTKNIIYELWVNYISRLIN